MIDTETIDADQKAFQVFLLTQRLIAADDLWTRSLASVEPDSPEDSTVRVAAVGLETAALLTQLMDEGSFVQSYVERYWPGRIDAVLEAWMTYGPDQGEWSIEVAELPNLPEVAERCVKQLHESGRQDLKDIGLKVSRLLVSNDMVAGDLAHPTRCAAFGIGAVVGSVVPPHTWGIPCAIAGAANGCVDFLDRFWPGRRKGKAQPE